MYKSGSLCVEDGSASGGVGAHERSEDSSSFLGGEADSIDSSGWSDTVGMSDMDQITAELANRGPQKSDLKLRYHCIGLYFLTLGLVYGWHILVSLCSVTRKTHFQNSVLLVK